jgi:hypothetical protein
LAGLSMTWIWVNTVTRIWVNPVTWIWALFIYAAHQKFVFVYSMIFKNIKLNWLNYIGS